jgi:MFS family permease
VFLAGQAVSLLGDGLAFLAVPLLVLGLSRDPLVSALSAASVTIGYLLVGLPSGALVDRFDPLRVLMAMDAARMLLFTALFIFAQAGLLRVWLILTVGIASGACSVFFETALVVAIRADLPCFAAEPGVRPGPVPARQGPAAPARAGGAKA